MARAGKWVGQLAGFPGPARARYVAKDTGQTQHTG